MNKIKTLTRGPQWVLRSDGEGGEGGGVKSRDMKCSYEIRQTTCKSHAFRLSTPPIGQMQALQEKGRSIVIRINNIIQTSVAGRNQTPKQSRSLPVPVLAETEKRTE